MTLGKYRIVNLFMSCILIIADAHAMGERDPTEWMKDTGRAGLT